MKLTIQAYWDPDCIRDGVHGCYVARIKENPEIHDTGAVREVAIRNLLKKAKSHGLSGKRSDYEVEYLTRRP